MKAGGPAAAAPALKAGASLKMFLFGPVVEVSGFLGGTFLKMLLLLLFGPVVEVNELFPAVDFIIPAGAAGAVQLLFPTSFLLIIVVILLCLFVEVVLFEENGLVALILATLTGRAPLLVPRKAEVEFWKPEEVVASC